MSSLPLSAAADSLLDALEHAVPDMAARATDVLATSLAWLATAEPSVRKRFEDQTRLRFEAIVAVTRLGGDSDTELLDDLADAGGAAAFTGATLPEVLLTLRVSRDVLVQTAIAAAEDLGASRSLALSVAMTQVLPAVDRLTDAVAKGYWSAMVTREAESFARYAHVVENSTSGVYEIDLDGSICYANSSMAEMAGVPGTALLGRDIGDLLSPKGDDSPGVTAPSTCAQHWRPMHLTRPDGSTREVLVAVTRRTDEGVTVGYDGIIRDVTAETAFRRQKNSFVDLLGNELRQPLHTILGLGVTLESYAHELPRDQMASIGRTVHHHAERIARLADDLHDISRIQSDGLTLSLREVDLATAIEAALRTLPDAPLLSSGVHVVVEDGLHAYVDRRRLEQIVGHLVENALRHGARPVEIDARRVEVAGETVARIHVADHGPGVPADMVDRLFGDLERSIRDDRLRDRASGLGLPLVRTLVEAMGGFVDYAPGDPAGASFTVTLPLAAPDSRG